MTQYVAKKKEDPSVTGWQEHIEQVCKKSACISQKRREFPSLTIDNNFGSFILNQLVQGYVVPGTRYEIRFLSYWY